MTPLRVDDALRRGVEFIRTVQMADGGFESFSSTSKSPFKTELTYATTFTPALILGAISGLNDDTSKQIRRKLATWLLAQRSPHWSFNYWAAAAPERHTLPYPDDLDDTFCALIALHQHDPGLIDQAVLANAVKLLIAAESQVGGPYRTWLADATAPKIWQDIDLAVNANVAGFLKRVASPLPNITQLIENATSEQSFSSPYYPSTYPIIYYIARAYDGPLAPSLADYLTGQQQDGWWGNSLQTALAITSLSRLGRLDACDEALERLLANQQSDGSWPAEAFCIDPGVKGKAHYSGAAALTTAFVLEALHAYTPKESPTAKKRTTGAAIQKQYRQILTKVTAEIGLQNAALRPGLRTMLARTQIGENGQEIVLLPHLFNTSLINPVAANAALDNFSLANLYGWMAYSVYDDFLDNEGKPALLPAANAAMRQSLAHFVEALPADTVYARLVRQTFNRIDAANAWEITNCRASTNNDTVTITNIPRYPNTLSLSERSLGHTLPVLGVLAAAGIPPTDRSAQRVQLALRHYITARQLNDDLHDWKQDLQSGIITYVVAEILRGLDVQPGQHNLDKLMPAMQRHFWHITLPAVCQTIKRHTMLARRAASNSGLLQSDNLITKLANGIDETVRSTLHEQSDAKEFLAAYTTPMAHTQLSPKNR